MFLISIIIEKYLIFLITHIYNLNPAFRCANVAVVSEDAARIPYRGRSRINSGNAASDCS